MGNELCKGTGKGKRCCASVRGVTGTLEGAKRTLDRSSHCVIGSTEEWHEKRKKSLISHCVRTIYLRLDRTNGWTLGGRSTLMEDGSTVVPHR